MKTQNYASFFESINQNTPISEFELFFDLNAKFKDPFHEVQGINKIFSIFQKMYENLDSPKFKIEEIIENKNLAYIKWSFSFSFKNQKTINEFTGVSRVIFNENHKVIIHEDYWDASENVYEKIPIIKHLIKYIKNRIKA